MNFVKCTLGGCFLFVLSCGPLESDKGEDYQTLIATIQCEYSVIVDTFLIDSGTITADSVDNILSSMGLTASPPAFLDLSYNLQEAVLCGRPTCVMDTAEYLKLSRSCLSIEMVDTAFPFDFDMFGAIHLFKSDTGLTTTMSIITSGTNSFSQISWPGVEDVSARSLVNQRKRALFVCDSIRSKDPEVYHVCPARDWKLGDTTRLYKKYFTFR